MTNKIYLLDIISHDDHSHTIRLIKKYNIILLNLFPPVLDNIIKEYVNDIIVVRIIKNCGAFHIIINDQYINYYRISFHSIMDVYKYHIQYNIKLLSISDSIGTILKQSERNYPSTLLMNNYMSIMYGIEEDYICGDYYKESYTRAKYMTKYKNNILSYYDNYDDFVSTPVNILQVKINNHKLFKNMIVINKCITNIILKKLIYVT